MFHKRLSIYLVHPISGLSWDRVTAYYGLVKDELQEYDLLQPLTAKGYLGDNDTEQPLKAHGFTNPVSTNHAIVERDLWMVRQADVVFADLVHAQAVSIGSMMELAWAHILGKHVVIAMEPGNIHEHAFVFETADVVFQSRQAAIVYLHKLATGDY